MPMSKQQNTPKNDRVEFEDPDETEVQRPGSTPMVDEVAMVSRNADNSDAQPNPTKRILSDEESAKADKAQRVINEK